jgi:hypothetical protein
MTTPRKATPPAALAQGRCLIRFSRFFFRSASTGIGAALCAAWR